MSAPRLLPLDYGRDSARRAARFAERPWFVFLDSCADVRSAGRYDVVAADPVMTLETVGETTVITRDGRRSTSPEDPFTLLAGLLGERARAPCELPFAGGALGYFAYDLGRRIERLAPRASRDIDIPDLAVGIYLWAIVVDHETRRTWLAVDADCRADLAAITAAWNAQDAVTPAVFASCFQVTSAVQAEITFADYARGFARIKRYIVEGDCYQVNFTQRFSAAARGDPWDAYQRLRNRNPAPFSAYLAYPGAAVLSSSPERFLKVSGGVVETKPIKGTRPRDADPARDAALAAELRSSLKDRAENLMIVDLLRNDLGKTCAIGSVEVPALFRIESFAKVHHLVSTVRGRLKGDTTAVDALRGCFPGGSITGAPKLRAMQIIEELEPYRRTVYCGAIGYLDFGGGMDVNIAIRTLVCQGGRMFCWAGGGIVMDSELEAEYQESLDKAAAMLEVFADAEAPRVEH
ncbi:MAG: aminodeoxychorismate synthase component I [Gammaproteobacteria bacterium]|nr:aminodeoxychorismate synthase component I [Gammaproteobacteria bacterium]